MLYVNYTSVKQHIPGHSRTHMLMGKYTVFADMGSVIFLSWIKSVLTTVTE